MGYGQIIRYYVHPWFILVNPRVTPEIVVWIFDTFDDKLKIKNDFTKMFEGELLFMFGLTFFLHKISQLCFYYRDFIKIVRQRLVAASTHELKNVGSSGGWLSGCNSACIYKNNVSARRSQPYWETEQYG